ncbi:hypothetical protein F5883DRAFT_243003 [Diaporthe sp. PMI_573]|nr:hypothetical protein F5883DRAFT_243003 [Diaporthaceae sp. PMI_573]
MIGLWLMLLRLWVVNVGVLSVFPVDVSPILGREGQVACRVRRWSRRQHCVAPNPSLVLLRARCRAGVPRSLALELGTEPASLVSILIVKFGVKVGFSACGGEPLRSAILLGGREQVVCQDASSDQ